jgi:hypothetical protein
MFCIPLHVVHVHKVVSRKTDILRGLCKNDKILYFLRPILLSSNIDVSTIIIYVDTSKLAKTIMVGGSTKISLFASCFFLSIYAKATKSIHLQETLHEHVDCGDVQSICYMESKAHFHLLIYKRPLVIIVIFFLLVHLASCYHMCSVSIF